MHCMKSVKGSSSIRNSKGFAITVNFAYAGLCNGEKSGPSGCKSKKKNGSRSKQRLILCTDDSLMPQQVFTYYGRRWSVEDLFNQLKNLWGLERCLATVTLSLASLDSDFGNRIRLAKTAGNILPRSSGTSDAFDSLAQEG